MNERVIKKADNNRYDYEILKSSQFNFNDNGKGGFMVEIVYKESRSMSLQNTNMDQVVLGSFEVSRDIFAEMRRNYACNSGIIFGGIQFRVHELVNCLNTIVAHNNIFASLSLDENGFPVKAVNEK